MVRTLAPLALTVAMLAGTMTASADTLKQKEMIAQDTLKVNDLAAETNKACGTKIAFRMNYPSFSHVADDVNNQSPWAYLANATDALKRTCSSDPGKQAVQAKIKTVSVSHAEAESESLTDGVFRYAVPYSGHSPATIVTWLQQNL